MDLSDAFDPAHDPAGKRQRSLNLYGIDQHFRASDPFVIALHRIVTCTARFTNSVGASVTVWDNHGPVELSSTGRRMLGDHDTVLRDSLDRLADPTTATVQVTHTTGKTLTTTLAAAMVGQEHAVIGTLTTWRPGHDNIDPHQIWLIEQLANAAVHALDERRRILGRRRDPTATSLRLVHGPGWNPERRSPGP